MRCTKEVLGNCRTIAAKPQQQHVLVPAVGLWSPLVLPAARFTGCHTCATVCLGGPMYSRQERPQPPGELLQQELQRVPTCALLAGLQEIFQTHHTTTHCTLHTTHCTTPHTTHNTPHTTHRKHAHTTPPPPQWFNHIRFISVKRRLATSPEVEVNIMHVHRLGAAKRRRERRLRSWLRHEQQGVKAAVAATLHHSAARGVRRPTGRHSPLDSKHTTQHTPETRRTTRQHHTHHTTTHCTLHTTHCTTPHTTHNTPHTGNTHTPHHHHHNGSTTFVLSV